MTAKVNYIHSETVHNTAAANEVLPFLFDLIKPGSVIDVGCGTGSWLTVAKSLGSFPVKGIDGIYVEKSMLRIADDEFFQHDLTEPLKINDRYDLAICLEVAEHLPETAADNIISILTSVSDTVLFSAAIPNQGGQFHLNEQWPVYWQRKFEALDFLPFDVLRPEFWNNDKIEWWYKQNMVLYIRKDTGTKYGLTPSSELPAYIHPQLFEEKIQQLNRLEHAHANLEKIIYNEVVKPGFYPSLKKLIKSIIK